MKDVAEEDGEKVEKEALQLYNQLQNGRIMALGVCQNEHILLYQMVLKTKAKQINCLQYTVMHTHQLKLFTMLITCLKSIKYSFKANIISFITSAFPTESVL